MEEFFKNRLSKVEYGNFLALSARSRAEDPDTQTGVVIFDKDWRTISSGFNGFAQNFVPDERIISDRKLKSCLINHAECNAILKSAKEGQHLFSVLSPCQSCSKIIVASSIKSVYFLKQYVSGATNEPDLVYQDIFKLHNVQYNQITKEQINKIIYWQQKNLDFLTSIYEN
jgi:deoxycytidylate deaminase